MPPKKKKQPTEAERNLLMEWITKDLQAHGASKLEDKLRKPEYGILNEDRNVFEQLLSTEKFYVYHSGDNTAMAAATERIRKVYDYFKDKDWKNFDVEKLKAHLPFLKEHPILGLNLDQFSNGKADMRQVKIFQGMMTDYTARLGNGTTVPAKRAQSRWRREVEGRSTLTARASHTIPGARHAGLDLRPAKFNPASDRSGGPATNSPASMR